MSKVKIAEKLLKISKELIAGGMGLLSGDASDVLEGIVSSNKNKSVSQIFRLVKRDNFLMDEVDEMGISDRELKGYIKDAMSIHNRYSNRKVGVETGQIKKVLNKYWNTINDLESDLRDAVSDYDIASTYSGYPAEKDAERLSKEIADVNKIINELSTKRFSKLVKLEENFIKKYGTPEEYADGVRDIIYPA